jgi:hypothetical protein
MHMFLKLVFLFTLVPSVAFTRATSKRADQTVYEIRMVQYCSSSPFSWLYLMGSSPTDNSAVSPNGTDSDYLRKDGSSVNITVIST